MHVFYTHVSYCYVGCNYIIGARSYIIGSYIGSPNLRSGRGLNDHICLSVTYRNCPNCASPFSAHSAMATHICVPLHRVTTMSHPGHDYRVCAGDTAAAGEGQEAGVH